MGNAGSTPTPTMTAAPASGSTAGELTSVAHPNTPHTNETHTSPTSAYSAFIRAAPPAAPNHADESAPASISASASASAAAPAVSLQSLAPAPPAAFSKQPTTFTAILPIIGGCGVMFAGSVVYGVRYGNKQATKMEENYAQYEVKPTTEAEVKVTPEMRAYALRRAMSAFGIGTALTLSSAAAFSYGVSQYWEVYSIKELSTKLNVVIGGMRMPFASSANRLVTRFESWVSSTWIGQVWSSKTAPKIALDADTQREALRQQEEIDRIWADAKRLHQDWSEGKIINPKKIAKAEAAAAAAAAQQSAEAETQSQQTR